MTDTLVNAADTLTVETQARDGRDEKGVFLYTYAFNYARRALRPSTNAEGMADAPETVRARRLSGRDAVPHDPRWTEEFRTRTDAEAVAEIGGSSEWTEQLDDDARDVAQDAFLLYWQARGSGRLISTRTAVRDGLRERRQKLRQRSINRRCGECRYSKEQCESCKQRLEDDKLSWSRFNRPTAMTAETRDTLGEVADKADPELTVIDSLPVDDGTTLRKHAQLLIRWVATGSSLRDVAEHIAGVTDKVTHNQLLTPTESKAVKAAEVQLQRTLKKLRTMFTVGSFLGPIAGNIETGPERYYGQGKGSTSSWMGMFLDILDREHGHTFGGLYVPHFDDTRKVAKVVGPVVGTRTALSADVTAPVQTNETVAVVTVPQSSDFATCVEDADTFGPEFGFILANEVYSE